MRGRAPEPRRAPRARRRRSLPEVARAVGGRRAGSFFATLKLEGWRGEIAAQIVKEIGDRLRFLVDVGLDYLTLDRSAETLSGGEAQRIRLASQVGSGLAGVMYILDEPSIGLHQRDNQRLLATLQRLRDLGNTVIVVEHDEEAIPPPTTWSTSAPAPACTAARSWPQGTPPEIWRNPASLTGQYLSGRKRIAVPARRRAARRRALTPHRRRHAATTSRT